MKELVIRFEDDAAFDYVMSGLVEAGANMGGKTPEEAAAVILEDALFEEPESENGAEESTS